jgi:signal transduction histidine kinase
MSSTDVAEPPATSEVASSKVTMDESFAPERLRLLARNIDLDVNAFHEELRRRNAPLLFWTVCIFNPVYVAWSAFDHFVAPQHWFDFLILRVIVALINTTVAVGVLKFGLKRYTWEAFWIIVLVYCGFVAPMLPLVGAENLFAYVMGFVTALFGTGLIPVWHPRWAFSVLFASVVFTGVVFFSTDASNAYPVGAVVSNAFVILTATGFSIVATIFRYDLARRDYLIRAEISAVAQRESEAKLSLARTSADLQQALERLKELDRLKSKFFANISHELRTPLTLILAPVEELAQWAESDHEKRQLKVIRRNAERLLGLINDLLDLSRLDAGGLRLNLAEIDIRSVAATVHENSQPAALAKSIDFTLVAEASEAIIWGDAHRLEIALTNLVSNAIKFTPTGGRIELKVTDLEDGAKVEVEDNGDGIPAEDLPRVFERFFQVSPADRRREGGVGIGLALAKELVELHGGTIHVESEPGVYTRFTIVIPFGRDHIRPEVIERRQQFEHEAALRRRAEDERPIGVEAEVMTAQSAEATAEPEEAVLFDGTRRARILLVEDHDEVRDFIRTLLEPHFDLLMAANGREAWELMREDPADLVVSDVMMPEMSGTDLCRAIKSEPAFRATPVILLTARVGSEATLEAYAHGADDFVAKPFHPRVLMARIRAQLKLRALGLQLAQQEKLAVVGTLAAGILHEVRNPVNAILNAARVLSGSSLPPETAGELIEVISDGAKRIEGITAALDSHARPAEGGATTSSDVREGLDSTVKLLSHRLGGVTVHRDYQTDRFAQAPAGPLNQVFLNLLDNAATAGAANIWLRVAEKEDALQIIVADDGPGVSPDETERIFDPFFTRRSDGSGTGLGLYLSRRIVEEHGGTLRVESHHAGGAEFVVDVPAVGSNQHAELSADIRQV